MGKNSKPKNMTSRLIAMSMVLALALPQTVVPVSTAATNKQAEAFADASAATGSAASGTAVSNKDAEELKTLLRANLLKDYDVEKNGELGIEHLERNNNANDGLTIAAQKLKSKGNIKSAKYVLYDINADKESEMIIRYNGKKKNTVRVYNYDTYDFSVSVMGQVTGVSDIRKNAKKKQIVIVSSSGKNKKTITAYKVASGKLKVVTTYKKSGKTYKKGKKKISKKAFNKYNKSVKKLSKIKLGSIPKEDYSYTVSDETFYGKGIFWRSVEDDQAKESFFMTKGNADAAAQDKYLAYSYSYDQVGWHEFAISDPALTRYVFGPSVVDPKTGKTYQQEDWEAMSKEIFGGQFAPPFLTETTNEYGKSVLDIEADGELGAVEVSEKQATNGASSYKGKEYILEYGDCHLRVLFFDDGPYKGRIAEAGIYYPHVTGEIAHDKWIFSYGAEAGNPAEHDPIIYDSIIAGGVTDGVGSRTIKIGAASDDLKQTIKTGENVRFELYGNGAGQFYTTSADGKETLLPLDASDDENESMVDLSEDEEAWVEFEKTLNPPTGQLSYGDVSDNYLYWRAK